jgi:mRNA interferase HicA
MPNRGHDNCSVAFFLDESNRIVQFLNGRQTTLPMHGAAELGRNLEATIKGQLGLK